MYKLSDNNPENFSLHDCKATKLIIGECTLTFEFEDGFYLCGTEQTQYTGRSELEFTLAYKDVSWNITVYLFSKTDDDDRMIRSEISPDRFAELLNSGAELEFLDEYKGYGRYLYDCIMWYRAGEIPRTEECQMIIAAKDITYRWNEVKNI